MNNNILGIFLVCFLVEACTKVPQKSFRTEAVQAPVTSDENGILTATVSANSQETLNVVASSSSNISNASVAFPPGALLWLLILR